MSVEGEVLAAMQAHAAARMRGDFDAVLDSYSDDWHDAKGNKKRILANRVLALELQSGALEILIDLRTVVITVDGDEATIGPIRTDSSKGRITQSHTLRNEQGTWRLLYTQTLDWESVVMDDASQAAKDQLDATALVVREHREQLLQDRYRPGYHFTVPEGVAMPFDPNGAIFWRGRYHLFYIFQDKRSGKKSDHWGHVSSTNLLHWRHHPTHLLDGMYSGNCFINEHGVPTICYHQVGQGNALAVALDDDLEQWRKLDSNPITPPPEAAGHSHENYRSWDPFAWYDGSNYYAIFGGEHPAIAKSSSIQGPWHYVGDLFAHAIDGVDLHEDVSCAELFRLGDKDVLLCISHRMGCRYYVGEWKDEQFYPQSHSQMSWADNSFFAPESLQDEKGRRIMWAWLLDYRDLGVRMNEGWSGTLGLPRVLTLRDASDPLGALGIEVAEDITQLRYRPLSIPDFVVAADTTTPLAGVSGNSLELMLEMHSADAAAFGIHVCVAPDHSEQTVIRYDAEQGGLSIDPRRSGPEGSPKELETAPFVLAHGEHLQLRVFIDKSVVEVFANGRQALMRRIYPAGLDSLGVSVFAEGGAVNVEHLQSWHIAPSNPY